MKIQRSSKGFTLVEIMIVVVIIGLLAAMAIPAFQKVRMNATRSTMDNDAKQLSSAANQYFMEYSVNSVATATLVGPALSNYMRDMSKGVTVQGGGTLTAASTFSLSHVHVGAVSYSVDTGKRP
jgi:type IV pilus assembly protein PilA